MTLIQRIIDAMQTSQHTAEDRSKNLEDYFRHGDFSQRAGLDQCPLILCGQRLEDLMGHTVSPPPVPRSPDGFPRPELRERPPLVLTHDLAQFFLVSIVWQLVIRQDLRDVKAFRDYIASESPDVLYSLFEAHDQLTYDLGFPPVRYISIGTRVADDDEVEHAFMIDTRGYPRTRDLPTPHAHVARIDLAEWQVHNFPMALPDDESLDLDECAYWIRFDDTEYYIIPHRDRR